MSDPIDVLVVDDDDDVRETLQIVLEVSGFRVASAANGLQALEYLRGAQRAPVVLLDLRMPVMSGWEMIDALREEDRLADVPIIICTSSPPDAPPGFEVVAKPVNLDALVTAIRNAAQQTEYRPRVEELPAQRH
jgi:CheY-like chemotaxis protein